MLVRAPALSLLLLMTLGCGDALAERVVVPARGTVRALALGGPQLVVARQPARGIVVERVAPGGAAQVVLGTSLTGESDQVVLAASADALAVGVEAENGTDYTPGRAFAGPFAGALREVAVCEAGLVVPPVAVSGARVAWREGACAEPAAAPRSMSTAAIVVGGADPAVPPRRIELPAGSLPIAIALAGDSGLVGILRPSFFAVDSVVHRFGPGGLGERIVDEPGRVVAPVGLLADGTAVLALTNGDGSPDGTFTQDCASGLFAIAPGSTQRRGIALGGCPQVSDLPASPIGARAAGDRISAIVTDPRAPADAPATVSLVSVRADGGDRRVLASGTYRPPLGMTADAGRIAWWQRTCRATSEIVVEDLAAPAAAAPANATCRASVLTRRARVRAGLVSLRLRCPVGCSGTLYESSNPALATLRTFNLAGGTHALRVRVPRLARRRGRLELLVEVEGGPVRSAVVRLRR